MLQVNGSSKHSIKYGSETIMFTLRFSDRKTLGITVMPDTSVVVTAPEGKDYESIETKVRKRAGWILKQKDYFRAFLPAMPPRRFVSGESHSYLGKQYRLKISRRAKESVKLKGGYIHAHVRDVSDRVKIEALVTEWYNERAGYIFEKRLERCLERFEKYKLTRPRLVLRKMSKRWGSFGKNGAVYLNPELIKAPRPCIDYVVIHELCHLIIPNHRPQFYQLLNNVMPDWEHWKLRLERTSTILTNR